jgi:hypothetical protein
MDGTVPIQDAWHQRVVDLVLDIETKHPGALMAAE